MQMKAYNKEKTVREHIPHSSQTQEAFIMLLETLRQKNPGLPFYSVNDPIFQKYGKVLNIDLSDLGDAVAALPMPESGSAYQPSIESLEKCPSAAEVSRVLYGEMPTQAGCCWGYNSQMNALEWHQGSEINLAVGEPLVLLLATLFDVENDRLDAGKVVAFLLEPGQAIEVYGTTLHYCPCQVSDNGFRCLVCLPKGTNTDLTLPHEDKRLTANNKWLLAHEEAADLLASGAQAGISGENWIVRY
jgi:hypothetical protein